MVELKQEPVDAGGWQHRASVEGGAQRQRGRGEDVPEHKIRLGIGIDSGVFLIYVNVSFMACSHPVYNGYPLIGFNFSSHTHSP
jgi:hypothetical protein